MDLFHIPPLSGRMEYYTLIERSVLPVELLGTLKFPILLMSTTRQKKLK